MPVSTSNHYRTLCTIRGFERRLLDHFDRGLFRGTTHTSLGQEAIAVASMAFVGPNDLVVSNHRCHGHYLAYSNDSRGLLAEIAGLEDGVSRGIGGSQHLRRGGFFSNGILGGMPPVAAGMAWAEALKSSGGIAVCFLGDGMLGEGTVYETFNLAALWRIPILFVVENNRYAQSTPISRNLAGSIAARPAAFGIPAAEIESNDIGELLTCFEAAFTHVRGPGGPFCQVVHTYRMGPHSKGDDTRDPGEIAHWAERDPVLLARRSIDETAAEAIERAVDAELDAVFAELIRRKTAAAAWPVPALDHDAAPPASQAAQITSPSALHGQPPRKVVAHLNETLRGILRDRPESLLLGEDIEDPYGGAFKVTHGLSSEFGSRVRSTPISEAAITGLATGLAQRGLRPIVEIMFGDFTTLIVDQIVNHMTKFDRMYGGAVACPVIVRTPMGGYRGYGPTHSQSLEKLFLGVPGLTVVACDPLHDQRVVWDRMLAGGGPCLYVENKGLYAQNTLTCRDGRVDLFAARSFGRDFPVTALQLAVTPGEPGPPDIVILCYGGMVPLAMETARHLFQDDECIARVVITAQIAPVPRQALVRAAGGCRRIVVLEEGTRRHGWGSEIAAVLLEEGETLLAFRRVAALDTIVPAAAEAEAWMLPSLARCLEAAREVVEAGDNPFSDVLIDLEKPA